MTKGNVLDYLAKAVSDMNKEETEKVATRVLKEGVTALEALNIITSVGRDIGEKFSRGDLFLAELVMAGEAMSAAVNVLRPALEEQPGGARMGRVVIATVEGDIHDLGKNIVATMLTAEGFEVNDLGVNCPANKIVDEAERYKADIIGMSCLLTSCIPEMADTIELLKEESLRQKYKVIIGGASLSGQVAESIGADAFGSDAAMAVKLARELVQT
jgi:methylmalonyl-CoA mutase cobalamin-binding domain/chain